MNRVLNHILYPLRDDDAGTDDIDKGVEAKAVALGWVPKEKWTQDEKKWVDAQTFLDRGETILPIVLKENRTLKADMVQLKEDAKQFKAMVEKQAQREKADLTAELQELRTAKAAAVDAGDGATVVALDDKIDSTKERIKTSEVDVKTRATPEHPQWRGWVTENPWYDEPELQEEANAHFMILVGKGETVGPALWEKVKKKVAKANPESDYFKEPTRRGNDVENDNEPSGETQSRTNRRPARGARTYDNLPEAAKAACERYIKDGWITDRDGKTLAEKRQAYANNYQWE